MKQQILVYGKCGGYVTIATFLGNQWWVTNKDEKLVLSTTMAHTQSMIIATSARWVSWYRCATLQA